MDLNEAGRTAAFGQGSSGNVNRVASSLQQDSDRFMDRVGKTFTPESVLNATVRSANGMASADYNSRVLSDGSELPTSNGMDERTRSGIARILLDGKPQIGTL